jgi:hypothetical protein
VNKKVISYIQRKMNLETENQVYEYLGITAATGKRYDKKKDLANSEILNLVKKARKSALANSIQILTEYYPITLTPLRSNHDFIDSKNDKNHTKLKNLLKDNHGIYVFYDSCGKAIYVGKAWLQTLFDEMRSAFNRPRDTMTIIRVQHTVNKMKKVKFDKAIKRERVFISDICAYFSAYKVDPQLIHIVEAIMIRAFSNNLTNSKIQNL